MAVIEKRKRYGNTSYAYSETVTADIVSISASQVLAELRSMVDFPNNSPPLSDSDCPSG